VYQELRAAQLAPDLRTFDRLFCAVRLAAEGARMEAARRLHQLAAGDWAQRREVLGVRSAQFNGAYALLSRWQGHMVEARLQHSERSLLHLARALERLNRLGDCLQLVQAYEQLRPGETRPHSAAIAVGARASAPRSVSYCLQLVQQLEARRGRLGARDYLALMAAQGWLHRDVGRVRATLARMKAAGHALDGSGYEAVVQVRCGGLCSCRPCQRAADSVWCLCWRCEAWYVPTNLQPSAAILQPRTLSRRPACRGPTHVRRALLPVQVFCRLGKWAEAEGTVREMLARGLAPQDSLWHVCLRHLVWAEAPREVCDAFLGLMPPQARHRFEALYSLATRAAGGGGGGGGEQQQGEEDEEEDAQGPVAALA
jgi:pentatricopeptide repeat protein